MSTQVPLPDRALVDSVRSGDRSARETLAERVGRSAYVFALQLTRATEPARDIAQESVLRFFQHLDRFDADRPLEPWLYQIVRNQVRDLSRREHLRHHESLDAWLADGRPEAVDPAADPVAAAEQNELRQRVWQAISALTDSHREIIVLRDFHDLSYREIAEVLSIPQGTVMSRLHTARRVLSQIIRDEGESFPEQPSSNGGER